MAGVYDNLQGIIEFENDGEIDTPSDLEAGSGMIEAQAAAVGAATYTGYSFVGLPV